MHDGASKSGHLPAGRILPRPPDSSAVPGAQHREALGETATSPKSYSGREEDWVACPAILAGQAVG